MQHTIANTTVRNGLIALLNNVSATSRANREATQALREYVAKHKLTREQAEPYVMRHCANLYNVVMYVDAMQFKKPAQTDKAGTKNWEAARFMKRSLLNNLPSAKPVQRVVHKVDKVEKMLKEFHAMSKAEQRRFMSLV